MNKYIEFKNITGIYVIKNTINDKIYIGSSINVFNRIKGHLKELKRNNHKNQLLQNFYNKHGNCFYFELIKSCVKDNLIFEEQKFLDYFKSYDRANGFNINKKANSMLGFKFSNESKKRMSESRKGVTKSKKTKLNIALSKQGSKHPKSKLTETVCGTQ